MKKMNCFVLVLMLLLFESTDMQAQGFLNKLKQKARQTVTGMMGNQREEKQSEEEPTDTKDISMPSGSDIVPKRKTATLEWDGTITPSKATLPSALMAELPPLPSAEKMARSSMEERDAYFQRILSVVARAEYLEKQSSDCSDEEMQALRSRWERKLQDLFGLTKEEMAILQDGNVPESRKKPLRDKVTRKILGMDAGDLQADLERFEKMSEKEQEAYIQAHPEFIQKMQNVHRNAGNFTGGTRKMTQAFIGYEAKMGKLSQDYINFQKREENHSYEGIAKKYIGKLEAIKQKMFDTDDATEIDRLYDEADRLLYSYRLEAAKEYRASLQRQIDEGKKFYAEAARLNREVVDNGDLPECAIGRLDLNGVIAVSNLLEKAYDDLPMVSLPLPIVTETLYQLPDGWVFCPWECGYPMGRGANVPDLPSVGGGGAGGGGFGCEWPLLVENVANDESKKEYALWECGKLRKINETELDEINNQADKRRKRQLKNGETPAYGIYKSRSSKRAVEYSQSGELIINGMITFTPLVFSQKADRLEWLMFDEGKVVKCTYKM